MHGRIPLKSVFCLFCIGILFFSPGTIILLQTSPIAFNLILLQRCVVFVRKLFARFFTYMSPLACGCPKALLSLNLHLPHSSIPRFVDVLFYLNMFNLKMFVLMPFLFPQCLLFWVNKVSGSRSEPMWEFNFKFVKLVCSLHSHKSRIWDLQFFF